MSDTTITPEEKARMSGLPSYNYPSFYDAAMRLRLKGVEILSPAEGAVTNDKKMDSCMMVGRSS